MVNLPRPEYPRPTLRRERWSNLNGRWAFAFDDDDRGCAERWQDVTADGLDGDTPFPRVITVPFCYQAELSGIGERTRHDVVWYARTFADVRNHPAEHLLLHFGAVDYRATVWVNGALVAGHEGGHTPFSADVTDTLRGGDNVVVVRAEDPLDDLEIPRGKQYWHLETEGIFYTPTTGIWQTVWLEPVASARVTEIRATPDLDAGCIDVDVTLVGISRGAVLRLVISLRGDVVVDDRMLVTASRLQRRYPLLPQAAAVGAEVTKWQGMAAWSPQNPNLYDLRLELQAPDGKPTDAVDSYFGVRKIEARDGRVQLNNRPFYPRLVLDQGYFPGGLLTAASDADLRRDIEMAKDLGFDGARKHQKVEDPRWLYWADRLGFLVWSEMPSPQRYSPEAVRRHTMEWQ
ncbi:MAG: glycoside hydrolase family 2, partial [Actinomycetota bacterium]|nr:glycoside hydrolase family 2 [Actinomycetota bacterium]